MPLQVTIDALGEDIVSRTLLGVHGRLDDMTPIWDDVDETITKSSVRQFASEGAYGSGGWAPLAESTLARKAALGQSEKILQATGRMKRSLTVKDNPEHLYVPQAHQMASGTLVPYAQRHQDGGGHLPQRRVLQLPESRRREVVKVIQRGILTGASGGR